jgi:lysozyme
MTARVCTPDRRVNKLGRDLIQNMEDCRLEAYRCQAGVWTVGWGETGEGICKGTVWTQEYADHRFELALRVRERAVSLLVKVPITDNQFSALVSFAYNAGTGGKGLRGSTLLRRLNAGEPANEVAAEFGKWVYASGVRSNGLVNRRALERALFLRPDG